MMSEYLRMAEEARSTEVRSSWALVSIAESLRMLVEDRQSASSPRPPEWLVEGAWVRIQPGAMFTNGLGKSCYTTGGTPRAVFGRVVSGPDRDGDVGVTGDDGITYDAHWAFLREVVG